MSLRLSWTAGLLGGAALLSGAAALALGLREPARKPREPGPPPALTDMAVPVGKDRRINLRCGGRGSPVVVLTGGAGAVAGSWKLVQPQVGRYTRTCAWDRAGFGGSDGSLAPQTAAEAAADLARALAAARITGPLVLVGHSLGAYETLAFADANPERVAGIVLVDPSTPGMFRDLAGGSPAGGAMAARATLAPYVRPYAACLRALEEKTPVPDALGIPCAPSTSPAKPRSAISFFESAAASSDAAVNPVRNYGAKPLIVLTAGPEPSSTDDPDPARAAAQRRARAWGEAHDAMARVSTAGVNRYVADSGHMIQDQRPLAVVEAVADVLKQLDAG